jgi:Zn-dependent metalloprotease
MNKFFSTVSAVLISTILLGTFPKTAQAQEYKNLTSKPIEERSEEYKKIKELSFKYLDEELGREDKGESQTGFKVLSMQRDELGLVHTKVQQTYNGVPVFGGEAIIHTDRVDSLFAVTNDITAEVDEARIDTEPRISADEAGKAAIELSRCEDCSVKKNTEPQLIIYAEKRDLQAEDKDPKDSAVKLAYRIELDQIDSRGENAEPRMPVYFIDAQTGEEISSYDNIQTQSVTNSGSSLYSGGVNFTAFRFGAPYYLQNLNLKIGTYNASTTNPFSDSDGFWTDPVQRAGVDAHWGAEKTLFYYQNTFGRNGVNGSGGPLSVPAINGSTNLLPSKVHYGSSYNNAFWNGNSMTYGDGDGSYFSPLVSLDVVGHELTHGVTQFSAGLVYSGESGGLNEAVSDIFGNMVERYGKGASSNNWKVGEEIYTPGTSGDALRYMDNPHNAAGSIDHYSEYYSGLDVHYSSGIANKEFYLLSQGGTHHKGGSMTGIGADRASAIWYYALTNFMTSGTNFLGARNATINAANALYGSTEANAVAKSWCMVGVGACAEIIYRARVKVGWFNIWLPWVGNGATAGTTGQSRPMRAAQIIAANVNGLPGIGTLYQAHMSNQGWLGWVSNGATAGSSNWFFGQQMEALQLKLTNAGNCHVNYQAHVANLGWLPTVSDGATAGTTGQSRRMEAFNASINCP